VSESLQIQPDTRFIQDLMTSGAKDLKKCMQCGTCSVVCSLSPADSTFPRKQMLEAQWGLKERLVGDAAVWLCHNCGDCTAYCPRGARPGDVFGALRQKAIEHFAFPQFAGKIVRNPKALVPLLLMPTLIFLAIAFWAPKDGPTPAPEFANVFPIPILEALFFAVAGIVLVSFTVSLTRFLKALKASDAGEINAASIGAALVEIFTHDRFSKCDKNHNRRTGHLLIFWGFAGLAVMGTAVGIGTMAGLMHTPLEWTSPWKIFANVSALVALAGCIILLGERIKDPATRMSTTYFDWFFLLTLTGVTLTGILSESLRLAQAARMMYGVYLIHLALIFALFLYAPYSKFAHFLYRTAAMAAMKQAQVGDKVIGSRQAGGAGAN
jgi:quinone-modifying oxidoreductase subunit QmoC